MSNRETPQQRYEKQNLIRLSLKLNRKTDPDILEQLDKVQNKQGYIKKLIREDIAKGNL